MGQVNTRNRLIAVGVDMQNDFCPGGSLAVSQGDEVIEPFNNVARYIRNQGGQVIFTRDWHPLKSQHFGEGKWPVHCVAGTAGAEFHRDLEVLEGDVIVSKGTEVEDDAYSGFEGRDENGRSLAEIIDFNRMDRLVILIGGLATDYCDKATALDALELAKKAKSIATPAVVVISDAIRAVNLSPEDGELAIEEMKSAGGRFLTSADIISGVAERL